MTQAPVTAQNPSEAGAEHRLRRALTVRQLTMMSIGGTLGAGFFLAPSELLNTAGVGAILAYLFAGVLVVLVMFMLGEMSAAYPASGAFSSFAERGLGRTAGVTIGWLYWVQLVVVVGAEALGAASILEGWIPAVGKGWWVLLFVVLFVALNLTPVKNFGLMEYYFAGIKVVAVVVFLVLGAAFLLGLFPGSPSPGLSNLFPAEGFLPNGWEGLAGALLIAVFMYGGTEVVTIAAAETQDPAKSVVRAVRAIILRIGVFYFGSVIVIAACLPWSEKTGSGGPFAAVLHLIGIPGADVIMEAIIVIALLSAFNANLYAASRMAYSLTSRGNGPVVLTKVSRGGSPWVAVLATVSLTFVIGIVLTINREADLLTALLRVVGSTLIVLWTTVTLSFIALRRKSLREGRELPFRMWGYPVLPYLALAGLVGVVALSLLDPDARLQLALTAALTAVIAIAAAIMGRFRPAREEPETAPVETIRKG